MHVRCVHLDVALRGMLFVGADILTFMGSHLLINGEVRFRHVQVVKCTRILVVRR